MTLKDDPSAIVLELGDSTEPSGERYLRRQGNPTIYVVSQHLAERLQPGPTAFERPKVATPAPTAPNEPSGGSQQPQLPPEVMRQLQEQIRAQQQEQ
jgi:hypothetical protein